MLNRHESQAVAHHNDTQRPITTTRPQRYSLQRVENKEASNLRFKIFQVYMFGGLSASTRCSSAAVGSAALGDTPAGATTGCTGGDTFRRVVGKEWDTPLCFQDAYLAHKCHGTWPGYAVCIDERSSGEQTYYLAYGQGGGVT